MNSRISAIWDSDTISSRITPSLFSFMSLLRTFSKKLLACERTLLWASKSFSSFTTKVTSLGLLLSLSLISSRFMLVEESCRELNWLKKHIHRSLNLHVSYWTHQLALFHLCDPCTHARLSINAVSSLAEQYQLALWANSDIIYLQIVTAIKLKYSQRSNLMTIARHPSLLFVTSPQNLKQLYDFFSTSSKSLFSVFGDNNTLITWIFEQ